MRILAAIPHIFKPMERADYASRGPDGQPRAAALTAAVTSLYETFSARQYILDPVDKLARQVNDAEANVVDVVICTVGRHDVLDRTKLAPEAYELRRTDADPMLLGFECHAALREGLGRYDYYCYLEDDIVVRDPWLFTKLRWFAKVAGDDSLLQPNRYERDAVGSGRKAYVDGHIPSEATASFRGRHAPSERKNRVITGRVLDEKVRFERAFNPHSGCFFLSAKQMERWTRQPYFLDRDTSFVGPLESAATLGIMRTFDVYKPARDYGSFLEVEHHSPRYIAMLPEVAGDRQGPLRLDESRLALRPAAALPRGKRRR